MKLLNDRPILKYGIFSALAYWVTALILIVLVDKSMVLFSFYFPGTIFGIALLTVFAKVKQFDRPHSFLIVILSTVFYWIVIGLCSKDIQFSIQIRHVLSGGIRAILLLFAIVLSYKVQLSALDFMLAFVIGIVTTFFVWKDNFQIFNLWLMLSSIGIWQISISFIIDNAASRHAMRTTSTLKNKG